MNENHNDEPAFLRIQHAGLPLTLDADQCALLLRCSKATVEAMALTGELPATQVGRGWLFVTRRLMAWLETRCELEARERAEKSLSQPRAKQDRVDADPPPTRKPGRPRKNVSAAE
jgi:excisionase family DNA binding protein